MLIRCRSKTGTARYQVEPSDDVSVLLSKIYEDAPNADPSTVALSNNPASGATPAGQLEGSIASLGLSHGDLLFVTYKDKESAHIASSSNEEAEKLANGVPPGADPSTSGRSKPNPNKPWEMVVEDAVDQFWETKDGLIPRGRDRMCRHGDKSMCDHCMPLEPFDPKYQQEHNIKHLSFHSYLRKLNIRTNQSTSGAATWIPPLSPPDYKVKVPCPSGSHPSWPEGICTKCQPSAITLALQQYRMVDHVEFSTPDMIDRLLEFWRRTGQQRFGWLLGHYEAYEEVPMGIKAVVEAIHEPPQEGDLDGLRLGLPWEEQGKFESLVQMTGLKIVGMVFTDLTPDEDREKAKVGKVQPKRHADSFFLSSLEAVFAAKQQMAHPNMSRFSNTGVFSSKFVTCVVTGDKAGDIRVEAYQVGDQAMAMVDADMIEPSVEPSVVRVKDDNSTSSDPKDKRYIPDVFYTEQNEYKLQVKKSAKPTFPTDYLLVSLTSGFPKEPNPLFNAPTASAFPIENRQGLHDQSLEALFPRLNPILSKFPSDAFAADGFAFIPDPHTEKGKSKASDFEAYEELVALLSDWHLLAYLDTCGIFDAGDMKLIARIAAKKEVADVKKLLESPAWKTLATIAKEHAGKASTAGGDVSMGQAQFETDADGFPIIPPDHDMMRTDTPQGGTRPGSSMHDMPTEEDFSRIPDIGTDPTGAGPVAGGTIVCPHCTFENPAEAVDCEICSLPLR